MSRRATSKPRTIDPRVERAIRFLVPMLQQGPMPFTTIRNAASRNGIRFQFLFRASNEAGVVYITEDGKPLLWELSGFDRYGRPTLSTQGQRNPYERAVLTDEPAGEVADSGRESSRSVVRTYGQSPTSETPGNETVVDPSKADLRPGPHGLASGLSERTTVGGQMVLWVNFAGSRAN